MSPPDGGRLPRWFRTALAALSSSGWFPWPPRWPTCSSPASVTLTLLTLGARSFPGEQPSWALWGAEQHPWQWEMCPDVGSCPRRATPHREVLAQSCPQWALLLPSRVSVRVFLPGRRRPMGTSSITCRAWHTRRFSWTRGATGGRPPRSPLGRRRRLAWSMLPWSPLLCFSHVCLKPT